eukprot:TRINITY_DN15976_c0_g1_i1.p1 TRINITY_DN15976_c0_g1~~TRINITY_DN15976_c0_g1_i1.p1  ORF type:complete len:355 (+),score=43.83 TRINITY_DN15976_c0_g1_i1:42-1106(+)
MLLNFGPAGFHHAPLSKVFLVTTAAASLFFSLINQQDSFNLVNFDPVITQKFQFWRLFTNQIFFSTPGEMLFGFLLLYFFRLFERQLGTPKFAGFAIISFVLSTLFQLISLVLFPSLNAITSGPYSIIFACFALYYSSVPQMQHFRLFRIKLDDKFFVYILGAQMLFSNGFLSMIGGLCGLAAGIIYCSDVVHIKNFETPAFLNRLSYRFILPHLQTTPNTPPVASFNHGRSLGLNSQLVQSFSQMLNMGATDNNMTSTVPLRTATSIQSELPARITEARNLHHRHDPNNININNNNNAHGNTAPRMISEENVEQLMQMGFSREVSVQALRHYRNDLLQATNALLDQPSNPVIL